MSESTSQDVPINPNDLLKILVATDNHLGYGERDRIRREDSFITFEEILWLAQEHEVDFVLLGGDLFDANKPSRYTLYRAIEILRRYTKGDRPVALKIHSDQRQNFQNGRVNYEDPDQNVALPIFMIHGNHDDPTGEHSLSAIDLLSVNSLVNYFGKSDSIDEIHVKPILISKGETKLALYGMGHIRDERLYRAFTNKKVKFYRPREDSGEWFNLFAVHQNRNPRGSKKGCITEGMLRGFFDVVVWGHEHECLIYPTPSSEGNFDVIQPGSSTICSLIPEEAKDKKICVLEVLHDQYRCVPLDLKTVRPFVYDHLSLSDFPDHVDTSSSPDEVADFLAGKVEELITEAKRKSPPQHELPPPLRKYHASLQLPLVRLKVDYKGGYATINPHRFGQRFVDRVANPSDILLFTRPKVPTGPPSKTRPGEDGGADERVTEMLLDGVRTEGETEGVRIEDLVSEFLDDLSIFDDELLTDAVSTFVNKEEPQAISAFVERALRKTQKKLWNDCQRIDQRLSVDNIVSLVEKYSSENKTSRQSLLDSKIEQLLSDGTGAAADDDEDDGDVLPDSGLGTKAKSSKKTTTTKTAAKKKTTTRAKKKKDESDEEEEEEEEEESEESGEEEEEPPKRGKSTRGRGARGGRGTKKATTTRTTRPKGKLKLTHEEEEEATEETFHNSDDEPPTKRARTTRGGTRASSSKKATVALDDDDEEEDDLGKKKVVKIEEDDDDGESSFKQTTKVAAPTVKSTRAVAARWGGASSSSSRKKRT